jgi:hypothetical protein
MLQQLVCVRLLWISKYFFDVMAQGAVGVKVELSFIAKGCTER